jgi:hypothetical protein
MAAAGMRPKEEDKNSGESESGLSIGAVGLKIEAGIQEL